MPMTRPRESASAPPELPGLSAASVWMTFSTSRLDRPSRVDSDRPSALTTPAVTVPGEAERVADGDDELTDAQPRGVAERRRSRAAAGRPDDGEVRQRVASDDLELELGAVDERGGPSFRAGHDVGRRHEVADRLDGHRGSGATARPAADLARHAQAGDRRDEPLGGRRHGDRVGIEGRVVRIDLRLVSGSRQRRQHGSGLAGRCRCRRRPGRSARRSRARA